MTDSPQPDSNETPSPRRGRARERHLRRRQPTFQPSLRRGLTHLAPAGGFKLSQIRIPRGRWALYIAGAVILVITVILALGRFAGNAPAAGPNALWIGTEWTYELHDEETMQALARRLRDRQIGTVYAWVSWLQEDETWRGAENFGAVRAFAQQFKTAYPEAVLMGWLSFPVDVGENNYRLDDEELQDAITDFGQRIVSDLGYDGIFLNVEPVWNGDENFLALMRKMQGALDPGAPLAVAVPPDWSPLDVDIPVPPLIVPGTVWDTEYKQSVALLSDEMVVMAYNSGLSAPADYTIWTAYQVRTFADAISGLGAGTSVVVGIPTYDSELPGHDTTVENVESALSGVKDGLQQAGDAASFVKGVAVYADWTTDAAEWAQFETHWLRR